LSHRATTMFSRRRNCTVDCSAGKLDLRVPGKYWLSVHLLEDVLHESGECGELLACTFDVNKKILALEVQLCQVNIATLPKTDSKEKTTIKGNFADYYARWDKMKVPEDEEDFEAKELQAIRDQMQQINEAEQAQRELHTHLEQVRQKGVETVLEEDAERLGLVDAAKDEEWEQLMAGKVLPEKIKRPSDNVVAHSTQKGVQNGTDPTIAEVNVDNVQKEVKNTRSKEVAVPQRSVDYSKWDQLECSDDEDEDVQGATKKDSEQLRKIAAMADQFNNYKKERALRLHEQEEYWKRNSVLTQ